MVKQTYQDCRLTLLASHRAQNSPHGYIGHSHPLAFTCHGWHPKAQKRERETAGIQQGQDQNETPWYLIWVSLHLSFHLLYLLWRSLLHRNMFKKIPCLFLAIFCPPVLHPHTATGTSLFLGSYQLCALQQAPEKVWPTPPFP